MHPIHIDGRRIRLALPALVIAIVMQIMLPIQLIGSLAIPANAAMGSAICSIVSASIDAGDDQPGDHRHAKMVCAACEITVSAQPTLLQTESDVRPPLLIVVGPDDRSSGRAALPRAPPRLNPPSRGPPLLT